MFRQRTAVFLINLVQDVNVLRPLVFMATRDFAMDALLLVSTKLTGRDLFGIWRAELEQICSETGARLEFFANDWEARAQLTGGGLIFAASESHLPNHATTHAIFRYAPPSYLRVTLQHGFECVGFRHSAAHDRAHGRTVSFGADVVCSWQPPALQSSMAASQTGKVHVTGPTAVLQQFTQPFSRDAAAPGIVCENLHSVRLNTKASLKGEFVGAFEEFCRLLAAERRDVVLRPHPGGQYVLKNKIALPGNARINNAPMYRVDLRRFGYGISAPSSVLVDMLLADIPVAVWRDQHGDMDTDSYAGLTCVSTPREWFEFAREAAARPQMFVDLQRRFLAEQQMPIEPREVFLRFAQIFNAASRVVLARAPARGARNRLLFVANAHLPTLEVCLEAPLGALVRSGQIETETLTEVRLKDLEAGSETAGSVRAWIERSLDHFAPDTLIFSRYSGPYGAEMIDWARRRAVPTVYQIDDDLLSVPVTLGERKYAYHNDPARLSAVRLLLQECDIVYASTERLRQRLLGYFPNLAVVTGPINCSGRVLRTPVEGPAKIIGYMASADHLPNLMMVLPAVITLLDDHPHLSFELFGSIPVPEELGRFGERVRKVPPVEGYEGFLRQFADRQWDVGICPLTPTEFNLAKSNNKWVEYTSAGVAVVASGNMIYDECCADGCGILAYTLDDWRAALEMLVTNDAARIALVERAQNKLEKVYNVRQHRQQILDVIDLARERAASPDVAEQLPVREEA